MPAGELVIVILRHQVFLNVVYCFLKVTQESVKILLVQENLMPLVPVAIKLFGAFGEGNVKIVTFRSPHIKEVGSSFASTHFKRVLAINSSLVTPVIHYL
jgi:hypothetical protein